MVNSINEILKYYYNINIFIYLLILIQYCSKILQLFLICMDEWPGPTPMGRNLKPPGPLTIMMNN